MRVALVAQHEDGPRGGGEGAGGGGVGAGAMARALADVPGLRVELFTENALGKRPALEVRGRLRIHRLNVAGSCGGEVRPERRAMGFATEAARLLADLAQRGGVDAIEFADPPAAALWLLARGLVPATRGAASVPVVVRHARPEGRADACAFERAAALCEACGAPFARPPASPEALSGAAAARVALYGQLIEGARETGERSESTTPAQRLAAWRIAQTAAIGAMEIPA